jgi:DNA polymerase/3'-5' exonuclease PolX
VEEVMSDNERLPYAQAFHIAQGFVEIIRPYCERVEIAGSLRRKKETIGDIEVVCTPKYSEPGLDLFGQPVQGQSLFEEYAGTFHLLKNGPHYKQIQLASILVDLFITTPEQWGVIYTIRTGSSDFSHWLVTSRQQGGGCPGWMKVKDGRVIDTKGHIYETPEEKDVFNALQIPWLEPERRIEGMWKRSNHA